MKKLTAVLATIMITNTVCGCTNQTSAADKAEIIQPPAQVDIAQEILETMTLEEKVGQMFFVRYPDDQTAITDAKAYNIGGYVLFAKDFEGKTREAVASQIKLCSNSAKFPMLISVDEEGGLVTRVSKFTEFRSEPFKSPQALFTEGGFEKIHSDTLEKCDLLKSLGINVNLAPVCDVCQDSSAFIYERTIGADAATTSQYVASVVSDMKSQQVGSALKHFPGYGSNGDTHTDIIVDNRPLSEFETADFLPFKAGISSGADIVLVSHNIVNAMDSSYPASLSPEVHRVLRENLGFSGVIMTDELSMSAITKYTDGNMAAVQAVKAGNDLLCCTDYKEQIPAVINAVKAGEISEEAINQSVKRIIQLKLNLGLIDENSVQH